MMTIKTFALSLVLGFGLVGCGMEQATEADIAETEGAITPRYGKCQVTGPSGYETGKCYGGGTLWTNGGICFLRQAAVAPISQATATWYVDSRVCMY
jgi:hypothetical protein